MSNDKGKQSTFGLGHRSQVILAVVLAVTLGIVLLYRLSPASDNTEPAETPTPEEPAVSAASRGATLGALRAEIEPLKQFKPREAVVVVRDPFEPIERLREILRKPERHPEPEPTDGPKKPSREEIAQRIRKEAAGLTLKGVFGGETRRVAFVNDEVVRIGSKIETFEVVKIRERAVVIQKNGVEVTLDMAEDEGAPPSDPTEKPTQEQPPKASQEGL